MAQGKYSLATLERMCLQKEHPGFVGTDCGHCGATINTLFGILFHCPRCGAYNGPPRVRAPLHETPICGNGSTEITVAEEFTHRERLWQKLPRVQKEMILAEALGGIELKLSALIDKPSCLEIENGLTLEEFEIFLRLLLETAEPEESVA